MKSKVTKYEEISIFSGKEAECTHHLIFGDGKRELADQDGLTIPLTNAEHNMSSNGTKNQIHDNPAAEKLSKMLGQAIWEKNYILEHYTNGSRELCEDVTREMFRKRYGRSYL